MDIYYFSLTGQTRRFLEKTPFNAIEITPEDPLIPVTEPFILAVPTYEKDMLEPVFDFLDYEDNEEFLKGIICSGNRNFAELFVFSGKHLAKKYQVPLLLAFEFSGTQKDVEKLMEAVKKIES